MLKALIYNKKFITKVSYFFLSTTALTEKLQNYWEVESKAEELAKLIQNAKYPIVFTGAGLSTSLGIPDYRSGHQTIIKTGPGLWNRTQQQNQQLKASQTPIDILVDQASPSLSHMFIATLINQNIFKHVISQNTDGLHLKSGLHFDSISELHGNRNLEYCITCKSKYNRDYRTLRRDGKKYQHGQKRSHITGRQCENCGGDLHDSMIYFGQKLPEIELKKAYHHAFYADLCICIGSSLTVKPSSNIPLFIANKQNPDILSIINLQQTPLDIYARLRIGYFCDDVLEMVANKLKVNIQKMKIEHFLQIRYEKSEDLQGLIIEGKDKEGHNLSFMKSIEVNVDGNNRMMQVIGHKCKIDVELLRVDELKLIIHHFGEKESLGIDFSNLKLSQNKRVEIKYHKQQGKEWQIVAHVPQLLNY